MASLRIVRGCPGRDDVLARRAAPTLLLMAVAASLTGQNLAPVPQEQPTATHALLSLRKQADDWAKAAPAWSAAHGKALEWLRRAQQPDGRWTVEGTDPAGAADPVRTVAATALAMLALESGLSTLRVGTHREPLRRAIKWLTEQQRDDGWFVDPLAPDAALAQAFAATAIVHAYAAAQHRPLKRCAMQGLQVFGDAARLPGGDQWASMPASLALGAFRRLPEADREGLGGLAAFDGQLARLLRPNGLVDGGAMPATSGPLPGTMELANLAALMSWSGTAELPATDPALTRVRAIPSRLGRKGELIDGCTLWFGAEVAFARGGEARAEWQRVLEGIVVPSQAGAGDQEGSFAFGCGLALLHNRAAETAMTALALAVPWYGVGR